MSEAWEDMTDIERASALELMGGKRQSNILSSVITNFETVEDVIETSMKSSGSALAENAKWLDSIEGKTYQFTNALQTMWSNMINSEMIKGFIDFGTDAIQLLDTGAGKAIAFAAAWKLISKFKGFSVKGIAKGLGDTIKQITTAQQRVQSLSAVAPVNGQLLPTESVNMYAQAVAGLTAKQQANLLASQNLTKHDIQRVLQVNKCTEAEQREALAHVRAKTTKHQEAAASQALFVAKTQEMTATYENNAATLQGVAADDAELAAKILKTAASKNATRAELLEMIQKSNLTTKTKQQIIAELSLTNAKKAGTAANYGLLASIKALYMANPVGFWITVATTILSLIPIIRNVADAFTKSAEEIKQEAQEIKQAYTEATDEINDNLKSIGATDDASILKLEKEFANLASGVDKYGNNISLTSDKYERYKELCEQIVGINPKVASGYDSATKAIGNNASALSQLIELQQMQAAQSVRNFLSDDNLGTLAAEAANDMSSVLGKNPHTYDNKKELFDLLSEEYYAEPISIHAHSVMPKKILEQLWYSDEQIQEILKKYESTDHTGNSSFDNMAFIGDYFDQIVRGIDDGKIGFVLNERMSKASDFAEKVLGDIDAYNDAIADARDYFIDTLLQAPHGDMAYYKLDDGSKSFIVEWIKNSEIFKIDPGATKEALLDQLKNNVETIQDIVRQFADQDIGAIIKEIDSLDSYTTVRDYENAVSEHAKSIFEKIGGDNNQYGLTISQISNVLGMDKYDEDISRMYDAIKNYLGMEFAEFSQYISTQTLTIQEASALAGIDWNAVGAENIKSIHDVWNIIREAVKKQNHIGIPTYSTHSALSERIATYKDILSQTSEIIADNTEVTQEYKDSLIELGISQEELSEYFDENNELIVTNAKGLNNLVKSTNKSIANNVKLAKSQAKLEYYELYKQLVDFTSGLDETTDGYKILNDAQRLQLDSLHAEMDTIQVAISRFSMLESQLLGVTDAYTKFEDAQNADADNEYSAQAESMVEAFANALNTGDLGTETARAAMLGLVPEEVYKKLDTVKEKMDAIAKYFNEGELSKYFSIDFDDDGNIEKVDITRDDLKQFFEEGKNKSVFTGNWEHFDLSANITSLEQFAKEMNITEEVAFALFEALENHDAGNLFDPSNILDKFMSDNLEYQAHENTKAMAELRYQLANGVISIEEYGNKMIGLDAQLAAGAITETEYKNAVAELNKQLEDGTITQQEYNAAVSGLLNQQNKIAEDANNQAIAYYEKTKAVEDCNKQLEEYNKLLTDQDGLDADGNLIDKEQVEQDIKVVSQEIATLMDELEQLGEPTEMTLKLATEYVHGQIEDVEISIKKLADGNSDVLVKIDAKFGEVKDSDFDLSRFGLSKDSNGNWTGVAELITSMGLNPEDQATIDAVTNYINLIDQQHILNLSMGSETASVVDTLQETNQILKGIADWLGVDYTLDIETNLDTSPVQDFLNQPLSKTISVTIKKVGDWLSGFGKADGTAHVGGSAYANGSWGTKKTETALTGELGPEIIVDPKTGSWRTVGDNGAEFTQVPRGSIIFNHKQTESLLKNGHITGRGKAYASGNMSNKEIFEKINEELGISPNEYNNDAGMGLVAVNPSPEISSAAANREWSYERFIQPGALEDGITAQNINKAIAATYADVSTNVGSAILGMGEQALDALVTVDTAIEKVDTKLQMGVVGFASDIGLISDSISEKYLDKKQDKLDKREQWASDFVAKDLYDEAAIAETIIAKPFEMITGLSTKTDSVFAEKADGLVQSAGQMVATAALQSVGVPWFLTTGATAIGGESENALMNGASFDEATVSAAISAAGEILTEKIGGISFGGKTLSSGFTDVITDGIKDGFVKKLATFGIDRLLLGEGIEEVGSNIIGRFGRWITYENDKTFADMFLSKEANDEYKDSYISGFLMGEGHNLLNKVASSLGGKDNSDTSSDSDTKESAVENSNSAQEDTSTSPSLIEKISTSVSSLGDTLIEKISNVGFGDTTLGGLADMLTKGISHGPFNKLATVGVDVQSFDDGTKDSGSNNSNDTQKDASTFVSFIEKVSKAVKQNKFGADSINESNQDSGKDTSTNEQQSDGGDDLIAVHNTSLEGFELAWKQGGFPAHSIAVIKNGMTHDEFSGEVQVRYKLDAINPDKNPRIKVYGADAGTPVVHRVPDMLRYTYNMEQIRDVKNTINSLNQLALEHAGVSDHPIVDKILRKELMNSSWGDTLRNFTLGVFEERLVTEENPYSLAYQLAFDERVLRAYLEANGIQIPTDVRVDNDGQQITIPKYAGRYHDDATKWLRDMLQGATIGKPEPAYNLDELVEKMYKYLPERTHSPLTAREYKSMSDIMKNSWRISQDADGFDGSHTRNVNYRLVKILFHRDDYGIGAFDDDDVVLNRIVNPQIIPNRIQIAESMYEQDIRGIKEIRNAFKDAGEKLSIFDAYRLNKLFTESDNRPVKYFEAKYKGVASPTDDVESIQFNVDAPLDMLYEMLEKGINVIAPNIEEALQRGPAILLERGINESKQKIDEYAKTINENGLDFDLVDEYAKLIEEEKAKLAELEAKLAELENASNKPAGDTTAGSAKEDLDTINQTEVGDKEVSVDVNGANEVIGILDNVNALAQDVTKTVTTEYKTKNTSDDNNDSNILKRLFNRGSNADGTAHANGSWGVPKTETALVGELGPEIIVDPKTSSWHTVGDSGAEFTQVKRGQIIFNHKQSEQLLKNGHITGRGKLQGGAFASGTAYSGIYTYDTYRNKESSAYKGSTVASSLSNAAKDLSKASDQLSDDFKEIFDWIEVRIEEITNAIDVRSARLDNAIGHQKQNSIVDDMLDLNQKLYDNLTSGASKYYEYASKLLEKVPSAYREAAQNGSIAIESFVGKVGESTLEAIQNYRDWVQKGDDLTVQAEETLTEISSLAKQAIDNIASDYENKKSSSDNKIEQYEAYNGLLETDKGFESTAVYQAMIEENNKNINTLKEQRSKMQAELNKHVESGDIKKYSPDWYDAVNDIAAVDTEIIELTTDTEGYQDSINELHFEKFDALIKRIEQVSEEAENLIDILGNSDLVDESGNWTDEGIASLGLYAQKMEAAEVQAKKYEEEIRDLNANWQKLGYTEEEYIDKLDELKSGQYDAIKAYHDSKNAIVDLNKERVDAIKEGIQKEIEAYEELIEKKKEELDAEKDLFDFQKSIRESSKNIADLERQLAALSADNSASARAKRAQLEAELSEANQELQDKYYDRSVTNQQEALDKELENFRDEKDAEMEALDEYLEKTEQVVEDSLATIQANTDVVYQTLQEMVQEYGLNIKNSITSAIVDPWSEGSTAIQSFSEQFGISMSATVEELESLAVHFKDTMLEIEQAGVDAKNSVQKNASTYTSANEKPKTQGGSSSSSSNGSSVASTAGLVSSISGTIYYGQSGDRVKKLQRALNDLGFGNSGTSGLDGKFGPKTLSAVKAFQKAMGLAVDGRVGPKTKAKFKAKGYAKGSTGVDEDQLAWIDELGPELQIVPDRNGRLAYIQRGTSIIPSDISENLMKLGQLNPQDILDRNRPVITPSKSIVNTEIKVDASVGTLLHVEHLDGNNPDEVIKLVDKAWDKKMQGLNNAIKKFAR